MQALDLKNKKALVMGLGLHDGGLGVTRFLVEQGASVTVTDLRTPEVLAPTLAKLAGLPVRYVLGEHREADFQAAELVIRNPAVPRESRFLALARQSGASIEMEMTIFFKLCRSKQVIGITGTRGKTSTTLLTGAILQAWRPDTVVAGNLRISALEKLDQIGADTPVVLELSSWQLEGLGEQHLSPPIAAVTNLSPDHLNRYRDMADYGDAKRNIYRWQDPQGLVVLNADDPLVNHFDEDAPGRVEWFSLEKPGLPGAWLQNGQFHWPSPTGVQECPASWLKLPGRHNQQNALAAIALANAAGCPPEAIRAGLAGFAGVPDRLELVGEVDGVRYYNDTTATSPAGVVAALQSFEQDTGQIVLLAGGTDKNIDFRPMAGAIRQAVEAGRLKRIILLAGSATEPLIETLKAAGVPSVYSPPYTVFMEAVEAARQTAQKGDLVLLSPGAASFGMFLHEFDRGQQFRQLIADFGLA